MKLVLSNGYKNQCNFSGFCWLWYFFQSQWMIAMDLNGIIAFVLIIEFGRSNLFWMAWNSNFPLMMQCACARMERGLFSSLHSYRLAQLIDWVWLNGKHFYRCYRWKISDAAVPCHFSSWMVYAQVLHAKLFYLLVQTMKKSILSKPVGSLGKVFKKPEN